MDCGSEAPGTAVVAATSDTEARGRAAGGMHAVVAAVGSEAGSEALLSAEAASAVLVSAEVTSPGACAPALAATVASSCAVSCSSCSGGGTPAKQQAGETIDVHHNCNSLYASKDAELS